MQAADRIPRHRRRVPLLGFLAPWIVGLGAALGLGPDWARACWLGALGAALALAAGLVRWRRPAATRTGHTLLAGSLLALGMAWGTATPRRPADWTWLPPREATLTLEVGARGAWVSPEGETFGRGRVASASGPFAETLGQPIAWNLRLRHRPFPERLEPGDRIVVRGVLSYLASTPESSPASAAAGLPLVVQRGTVLHHTPNPAWLARLGRRLHGPLRAMLLPPGQVLPQEARTLAAMMLGEKALLDPQEKQAALRAGTMHLFAISGLHVVVVALVIETLLRLLRLPGAAQRLGSLTILLLYVAATGLAPSALRAWLMLALRHGAAWAGRPGDTLGHWTAAAAGVLILQPELLGDAGFLLSYTVVAALILQGGPLAEYLKSLTRPDALLPKRKATWLQRGGRTAIDWSCTALASSFAATLASAPLCAAYFGLCSPGGILLNLLLIPLGSLVVVAGCLHIGLHLVGLAAVAGWLAPGAWTILAAMRTVTARAVALPGCWFPAHWPHPGLALGFTALLLATMARSYYHTDCGGRDKLLWLLAPATLGLLGLGVPVLLGPDG